MKVISLTILISCLFGLAYLQTVPESVRIANLPDLTQDVYQGWINSDNETQTYLYYQLYSADGTYLNSSQLNTSIPLLLYLEGGPCDSSALTVWSDFGPYGVNSNINMTGPNNPADIKYSVFKRNLTWSGSYHVLAVDSPVFTGYSFSKTGFLGNDTETATSHLVNFLTRFYEVYGSLAKNPLHIIGHSYGGHWAPSLGYALAKNGNAVNLAGIILHNPLTSQKAQNGQAAYFLSAGVTDRNKRDFIASIDDAIKGFLKDNDTVKASIGFTQEQSYLANAAPGIQVTTNITLDNIRRNRLPNNPNSFEVLAHMMSPQTFLNLSYPGVQSGRDFLNIPSDVAFLEGYCTNPYVLAGDVARDYSFALEFLLGKGIQVTILGGQDDGIILVPGLVQLANSLSWSGQIGFRTAQRKIWRSGGKNVLGNYKSFKNLNLVTLYKSGHLVTFDQPEATLEFMDLTLQNKWV